MSKPSPVEVVTFGCRLNAVESEAMRRAAAAAGHTDLVIVNTCAVTAEAARQARQAIRRLRRERPGVAIVVTGCAAEVDRPSFAAMEGVAALIANPQKTREDVWRSLKLARGAREGARLAPREGGGTPPLLAPTAAVEALAEEGVPPSVDASEGLDQHTRAFVEVQNGCDHRCTFCIIPFGRGPSRSVPLPQVVAQVRRLVERGVGEVVLTGVDVTSYGGDLEGNPGLGTLVRALLAQVPGLARLRLSSLDCVEVDGELFAAFDDHRLMPHLHLSLQAGDDLILKRMKRRHTFAEARDFCAAVRARRPDVVFGADIIAGFPTETEAMFERSLDLIEACGVTHLHVFPYSPRPGTAAARMPQHDGATIKARAKRLREAGAVALLRHLTAQKGRRLRVLAERGGVGRAEDFTLVRMPGAEAGRIFEVTVADHDGTALIAA